MATRKQHNADLMLVLLLFFVYAGCALLLCVMGANSYRHTVAVMQEDYDQRTGVLYVAQKVHQNDIGGALRLASYKGTDALVLVEQQSGQGFETWIFIKDGFLCEEVIAAGAEVLDAQAQVIMPMQTLKLSLEGEKLLTVSLTTNSGVSNSLTLALRSGGGTYNAGSTPPPAVQPAPENPSMSGPTIMNAPLDSGAAAAAAAAGGSNDAAGAGAASAAGAAGAAGAGTASSGSATGGGA